MAALIYIYIEQVSQRTAILCNSVSRTIYAFIMSLIRSVKQMVSFTSLYNYITEMMFGSLEGKINIRNDQYGLILSQKVMLVTSSSLHVSFQLTTHTSTYARDGFL